MEFKTNIFYALYYLIKTNKQTKQQIKHNCCLISHFYGTFMWLNSMESFICVCVLLNTVEINFQCRINKKNKQHIKKNKNKVKLFSIAFLIPN